MNVCCDARWHVIFITIRGSFTNMDNLPEEIILRIFTFLPLTFVFKTVSCVSKQFRRLAYDRSLVKFATNMIQEVDIDKQNSFSPEASWRLLSVISVAPSNCVKSLAIRNGNRTWEVLKLFQTKWKEVRILNLSGTQGTVPDNVISNTVFKQLHELNVSGTGIDDYFLRQLSQTCSMLYCVNISKCSNVTHAGISSAAFNLAMMNMSYCQLGVESVIHVVREYGCTVTCIKGIDVTVSFADVIGTLFPEVIEIGIPVICGFSFQEYTCPNICYWCSANDVTRNLLSIESSLYPYVM